MAGAETVVEADVASAKGTDVSDTAVVVPLGPSSPHLVSLPALAALLLGATLTCTSPTSTWSPCLDIAVLIHMFISPTTSTIAVKPQLIRPS